MEQTVKERLVLFIKYRGLSQKRFEQIVGLSNGYVNNVSKGLGASKLADISRQFPELNTEWLLTGNGVMLNDIDNFPKKTASTGCPYFNVDFAAGFSLLENDQTTNPEFYVDCKPYNNCDAWVNAHGDSMAPTISSGDIVAMKRIEDIRYLINGEIYGIVTSSGLRTIKRVRDNGDTITLIPDNKEVAEQTIPKNIITHVYQIKGAFKHF